MKSTSDIINDNLVILIDDITATHKAAGQYTTGKTIDSLEIRKTDTGAQLLGNSYIGVLERGRGAGKVPSDFVDILKRWIQAKGLSFKNNADLERFANALSWKISREGTKLYRSNQTEDIFTTPVMDFRNRVSKEIGDFVATEITQTIYKK